MNTAFELGGTDGLLAKARFSAFLELAKPRILFLVLVATASGFYLAVPWSSDWAIWLRLIHVLVGTAMVVAASNALNQYFESDLDARMKRTADRPLPSGRLTGAEVLLFATVVGIAGALYLIVLTNRLTGALAVLSLLNYVFVYTPLKRFTTGCVFVGAVSGALPPVIGWAAAAGSLGTEAWFLFAVVFCWQLPHFASIAWLYREDYARAGYAMLPVVDPGGIRSDMHLITHSVALLAVSLLPVFQGSAGPGYAVAAVFSGVVFLAFGGAFVRRKSERMARLHILSSIIYLPFLFASMMLDRACLP